MERALARERRVHVDEIQKYGYSYEALLRMQDPNDVSKFPELFVKSDIFMNELRERYSARLQENLVHKMRYKLVDALEETINFHRMDLNMYSMPVSNTYIPVKNTIMKKPNLLDEDVESDEFGYRFHDYSKKDKTR